MIHSTVFYRYTWILFWEISLLPILFNLGKFSAFIDSFSACFASSPSFYRYCLFSAFLPLFSSQKAGDLHLCNLLFIIYHNKVPIQHAIRLVEKACFFVESTSLHWAVNSWVNAVFTIFDLDLTLVCTFCIILAPCI